MFNRTPSATVRRHRVVEVLHKSYLPRPQPRAERTELIRLVILEQRERAENLRREPAGAGVFVYGLLEQLLKLGERLLDGLAAVLVARGAGRFVRGRGGGEGGGGARA